MIYEFICNACDLHFTRMVKGELTQKKLGHADVVDKSVSKYISCPKCNSLSAVKPIKSYNASFHD